MADKSSGEINYVSEQNFLADAYRRELRAQRETWPANYGALVDKYKEMNEKLDKGKPLPVKALRVREETFKRFAADPDKKQPLPLTTKRYGWNVGPGTNGIESLDNLTKRPPRITINKQLGWAWGSQD